MSGRCLHTVILSSPVRHVAWNPAPSAMFYAACSGTSCFVVEPKLAPHQESPLKGVLQQAKAIQAASTSAAKDLVTWALGDDDSSLGTDVVLCIQHKYELKQVSWHAKGDYFTTLNPQSNKTAILVHQLSKFTTQSPFSKNKSDAQSVRFHPTQPILFVALSRRVQVYNLVKQSMVSNLIGGFKQLSCMSVHPSGDHVIIGSHDRRLSWFDLELSNKPYKTVRGREGYRDVRFHLRHPLFCAAAEDGSVVIFHGRVYGDLSSNPLIVPVNKLRAHTNSNHDGAMSACFHPVQVSACVHVVVAFAVARTSRQTSPLTIPHSLIPLPCSHGCSHAGAITWCAYLRRLEEPRDNRVHVHKSTGCGVRKIKSRPSQSSVLKHPLRHVPGSES
jgi:ribosome biogenesis protein ERB1